MTTRALWISLLTRIVERPLAALSEGRLKAAMPVEALAGCEESRREVSHLEALGRSLAGLAPWLERMEEPEAVRLGALARAAISQAVDPASPDRLNFSQGGQPLVDAAFLAHALLRAPRALWEALEAAARSRLIDALRETRRITPAPSNWLLFSAMVEAALLRFTGEGDLMRIAYALRQHEQWYKGDGIYGDGSDFHWDYYNSFVIQPMQLDIAETVQACGGLQDPLGWLLPLIRQRAVRHAAVQERLIAPDGSFPPIGRSLAYRCGAFQHLAQMALRRELPEGISPAQVRCALTAVIRRTLEARGTFDESGWLRIGLAGHQPGLAERYISTGSLYLCSMAFLPLGLPEEDPFWAAPDQDWTSVRVWRGEDVERPDGALK